ncbi:TSUP family transporter, partial [Enterococcus lactis]
MSSIIFLIVFGVAVGMLTILLGGGGGAIYLGILTGVIGLNAANAASTSLVTSLPPLIIGAISYYRQGKIDVKIGNQMLIAALP